MVSVIIILGSIFVRPGDVARLHGPLIRQIEVTRAEAGCDHYALAYDVFDPTIIRVSERWRDQPSFATHLVSDQMVQFNIDFRAARILRARVDSYHPGGEVRKLIDLNAIDERVPRNSASRVIVMGSARLAPGDVERFTPAMRTLTEATRIADGCEHCVFGRDAIEPDVLHIAERWRDAAALAMHLETAHVASFNATLAAANARTFSLKAYDENGVRNLN